MSLLGPHQVSALRTSIEKADARLSPREVDALLQAVRRQHEDPDEHDRGLISERLGWSPDERLQALQSFLRFVERARKQREP